MKCVHHMCDANVHKHFSNSASKRKTVTKVGQIKRGLAIVALINELLEQRGLRRGRTLGAPSCRCICEKELFHMSALTRVYFSTGHKFQVRYTEMNLRGLWFIFKGSRLEYLDSIWRTEWKRLRSWNVNVKHYCCDYTAEGIRPNMTQPSLQRWSPLSGWT